jgi:hypothetical protein
LVFEWKLIEIVETKKRERASEWVRESEREQKGSNNKNEWQTLPNAACMMIRIFFGFRFLFSSFFFTQNCEHISAIDINLNVEKETRILIFRKNLI